ncbi:MAG TPA: kelch repeat-containing protein, partial [Rhodothermales bacterium]|nr:kelch repeat-containing protein [Rhodothermales bacterium]
GNAFFKDVWAFDLRTESWTELIPTTEAEPNDRYGVAAVYDPASRDLVTFAGFTSSGRFDDTWRFDIARSAWSEVLTGSDNPGRRCLHTAAYDAARHRMIVYGGQRTGPLGDIWAFDLSSNTWAELLPLTDPPSARYFVSTIYDEANDRMLMFGGNQGNQVLTDELWAFELSSESWQLLLPGGNGPSAREGSVGVYVPHENRLIVIGGRSTSYLNDVWALELRAAGSGAIPEDAPSDEIRLHANYPNPVAGSTAITYDLPRPMSVDVTIYDLLGREVQVLARNMHAAGRHTITWDASRLIPGIYFCRLTGGGAVHGRRLVIAERP